MQIPIGKVESPDELLEIAFGRARKAAGKMRSTTKGKKLAVLTKKRMPEFARITAAADTISAKLWAIVTKMPKISELAPFYQELAKYAIDMDQYRKSLGAVKWAQEQVRRLTSETRTSMRQIKNRDSFSAVRTALYGRMASVLKQIKKDLAYLEKCRKTLKEFPAIKTGMPTVVLAGYPNVGKSTLLMALTGATPKIAHYPFTTQQLMLGYSKQIQFIDTPGLLDRPLTKRNPIEKHAILALKHLATLIAFVIDPTESCGYNVTAQLSLLKQLKADFQRPIIIILTKTDIATPEQIAEASISGNEKIEVNTKHKESVNKLLSEIEEYVLASQKTS